MTHKILKVGDIRQEGDEIRRTEPYAIGYYTGEKDLNSDYKDFSEWQPCGLLGHRILPVDLKVAEFRRPI